MSRAELVADRHHLLADVVDCQRRLEAAVSAAGDGRDAVLASQVHLAQVALVEARRRHQVVVEALRVSLPDGSRDDPCDVWYQQPGHEDGVRESVACPRCGQSAASKKGKITRKRKPAKKIRKNDKTRRWMAKEAFGSRTNTQNETTTSHQNSISSSNSVEDFATASGHVQSQMPQNVQCLTHQTTLEPSGPSKDPSNGGVRLLSREKVPADSLDPLAVVDAETHNQVQTPPQAVHPPNPIGGQPRIGEVPAIPPMDPANVVNNQDQIPQQHQ
ncbi:hypothetical protein QAD02_020690 [Eretmocerus hayati]|uniref:Uncharacterized protein n=1 Tax=Eretmocerus hayati TaxID=131215 RepID=A0ACC2PRC0_9HYME|nr:hypothetical protein QAD02_020690 [Eretmocerus hayati]